MTEIELTAEQEKAMREKWEEACREELQAKVLYGYENLAKRYGGYDKIPSSFRGM